MPQGINVRKGVMVKRHRTGGFYVYMYLDKPGEYLNAFGAEVPEIVASAAGYDVKTLKKERIKRERMSSAMSEIEMELELANSAAEEIVLKAAGDYRIVSRGLGRADVMDNEDNLLTPRPIPEAEAMVLLDHLSGGAESKAKK